ncbi:MAG: signal peptidase I [Rhodospirillaceae bacterium]|jgi:signal peptidase I|nr:MAG: signal peptidase I [Rhodospirillaceae bacterium]
MPRKTSGTFQEIWDFVKTVIWAGVIAILIRTFLYEPFNIPSGSMIPTLLIGDYLFVSKTSFGYSKYSFPLSIVPFEGRIWDGDPKRGDVIVFRPPGEVENDFIKRLIGLPGDRVQVRNGILYINGEQVKRERIEDYVDPDDPNAMPVPQYIETLPGGVSHRIIESSGDSGSLDNTPIYVVPADHYFMMGDNRDGSNDSRMLTRAASSFAPTDEITEKNADLLGTVGFVPKENLIGPAKILFFSWSKPFHVRWNRLFDLVK